jgi:hypothetical protein
MPDDAPQARERRGFSIADRLQELVVWTQIRDMHKLKLIQQMYVWLVLVPVLATFLAKVPDHVTLKFLWLDKELELPLRLPFSWQLFYFAAVCFVVSNVIYHLACPRLIKDHPSFASFLNEWKSDSHLEWYHKSLGSPQVPSPGWHMINSPDADRDLRAKTFWYLHAYANLRYPWPRRISGALLAIGIGLTVYVVIEGFLSVVRRAFAS